MSQTTPDAHAAHENAGSEQSKPSGRPRRSRRAPAKSTAPAQPEATTGAGAAAAQPAAEPARPQARQQQPKQQPKQEPAAPQEAAATTTPAHAEPRSGHRGSRGGRGHRGGRKPAVQLVPPPTAQDESAEPQPELDQASAETTEEGPRVVPVVTDTEAQPTEPIAVVAPEAYLPPTPAVAQSEPAQPASRRYRFDRRSPAAAAAAPVARAERLSGPIAAAPTEDARAPEAAPPAAETAEPWRATVAEVAPDEVAQAAAATEAHDTVDDLVAALGLSGAAATQALAVPTDGAEGEAPTEAAEGEAPAAEAEAQPSSRRRRRRRRGGGQGAGAAEEENGEPTAITPLAASGPAQPENGSIAEPEVGRETRNGFDQYGEYGPFEQPYSPYNRPARGRAVHPVEAQPPAGWEAAQEREPQPSTPFGAPEPSFARGFGPQPRGVAGPAPSAFQRPGRGERGMDVPPMSPNQLASTVTHSIQQQTDRLLAELRGQAQVPSMTVMFPPFPSTERIGVFVDVANLVYSARSQRMHINFGKLLDFLRGTRRLVRAHAYAPTNPEPGAEQAFLSAVKGVGYRITTKNYKTFASGAKKADMDLDLCMDIVRLVDAKSLDTVVLVSGDSDFLPLLEYCSDRGVRVEVAAFEDAAAMILRQSCDLFINLSLVDEIRS
jgi:uncharacterized LabA/DUF88 family protein